MATDHIATAAPPMRIGDLAARTGVTVETLRYYEQRGLVQPSGRRGSGYREYPADAPRLVRFIKRAQGLGFTLSEVEELVRLRERAWSGDAPRQLREAAATKVEDIDRRMRELGRLRNALTEMIDACDASCGDDRAANGASLPCALVEAFDTDDTTPSTTQRRNTQ